MPPPTYTYVTFGQVLQQLANRLYDEAMVFWSPAELQLYVVESLRTWNALAAYWKNKADKKLRCSHLREDGTCLIAWATQSDNVERGYCPNCDSTFFPEDGEIYQKVRLLPRGRKENIRYVA